MDKVRIFEKKAIAYVMVNIYGVIRFIVGHAYLMSLP